VCNASGWSGANFFCKGPNTFGRNAVSALPNCVVSLPAVNVVSPAVLPGWLPLAQAVEIQATGAMDNS